MAGPEAGALRAVVARAAAPVRVALAPARDRWRHGSGGRYLARSRAIPGWTEPAEAEALLAAARALPPDPVVVEVGVFLGRSTVVLAGALEQRGDGAVHAVDPFDGSGDAFSVPVYRDVLRRRRRGQRAELERNLRRAGVSNRVTVHAGTAEEVGDRWTVPIDLLFLDGDQSPAGARRAFERFAPHVRTGGLVALHNSDDREYAPGHDGHRRLVVEALVAPDWTAVHCVATTTFARRVAGGPGG